MIDRPLKGGPFEPGKCMMMGEYLLAIPVFNEERFIENVLDQASHYCRDILVVNDGSTDGTPKILSGRKAQAGFHVIAHAENRGYGKSLADAFAFAQRNGFSWLITMDCDEQHEPAQIPGFLQAIVENRADIISGTRYPKGHQVGNAPADRRAINERITAILNERLGLNLTDAFCGFKAYRVAALGHISVTIPGYAMPIQFWVQAARAGLRVSELPVRLIYNDPTRHFGGHLDDPAVRMNHYLAVLEAELSGEMPTAARCIPACHG